MDDWVDSLNFNDPDIYFLGNAGKDDKEEMEINLLDTMETLKKLTLEVEALKQSK